MKGKKRSLDRKDKKIPSKPKNGINNVYKKDTFNRVTKIEKRQMYKKL